MLSDHGRKIDSRGTTDGGRAVTYAGFDARSVPRPDITVVVRAASGIACHAASTIRHCCPRCPQAAGGGNMWTRRDQLQAYQFLRRRLVSALVFRAANHAESPNKRLIVATVTGIGFLLLLMAGFGIYGLFRGSTASQWTAGDRLIVEKETGALYVLDAEETLRPVLNYASAALFLGSEKPRVDNVSQQSLRVRPRGTPIGIPGAPESVPKPESLLDGPWTACSQVPLDRGGTPRTQVTLLLGDADLGAPFDARTGMLVTDPTSGEVFALQEDRLHKVASDQVARALGYTEPPIPVGSAWLNTVPRGADLDFIDVPDAGAAGPDLSDQPTVVGEVMVVQRQADTLGEYLLVLPDGLAPISQTEAELILDNLDNPARPDDGAATPLSAGVAASAPQSARALDTALPAELPQPITVQGDQVAVCATALGSASVGSVTISVTDATPLGERDSRIPADTSANTGQLADVLSVAPGRGSLVREVVAGGAGAPTTYLVTDEGRRYPISLEEAASFGYDAKDLTEIPKSFSALLPTGPALSARAAAADAPSGGRLPGGQLPRGQLPGDGP
jgi:type VII secretion protein EccB